MSSSIQPPGRSGSAQRSSTSSNAVSIRISYRGIILRSDRVTRSPSSGRIPRSNGDHQPISPGRSGIGNTPAR